jgi:hypothetical protein
VSPRTKFFVHAVATVTGDFTAGFAVAAGCVWIVEVAGFGLFVTFLAWLIGLIVALALSQFVVHPVAAVLLSDRKLDHATAMVASARNAATHLGRELWRRASTPHPITTVI